MGAIGIIARTLSPRAALIVGALASGLGMVLLILAVRSRDLLIYLLATAAAGGAHCLLFVGGLQVSSAAAYCRPSIFWVIDGCACLCARHYRDNAGLGFSVDLGAAARAARLA